MLFVIAENAKQAEYYAKSAKLNRREYKYVSNPSVLEGIPKDSKIIKVGTWYMAKDEILDKLRILLNCNFVKEIYEIKQTNI